MSEETTAISTNVLPEHMRGDAQMGAEHVSRYIIPPRLVLVQSTSKPPLNKHDAGTVLLMPSERVICEFSKIEQASKKPMMFVPIYYFSEYRVYNPEEIHLSHGKLRERTFDDNSETARRAIARDPKLREVVCPEFPSRKCTFEHRMNYLWWILTGSDEEPVGAPCFVSFKRTELSSAFNLNTLIQARKAPIFGCVFATSIGPRQNNKGVWYGYDMSNPPLGASPWVTNTELYESLKKAHVDARTAHEAQTFELPEDDDIIDAGQPEPAF